MLGGSRVEPAPEWMMEKEGRGDGDTVCQVIREIYHLTGDEEIRMKCRVAVAMAKRMAGKLKWYKENKLFGILDGGNG